MYTCNRCHCSAMMDMGKTLICINCGNEQSKALSRKGGHSEKHSHAMPDAKRVEIRDARTAPRPAQAPKNTADRPSPAPAPKLKNAAPQPLERPVGPGASGPARPAQSTPRPPYSGSDRPSQYTRSAQVPPRQTPPPPPGGTPPYRAGGAPYADSYGSPDKKRLSVAAVIFIVIVGAIILSAASTIIRGVYEDYTDSRYEWDDEWDDDWDDDYESDYQKFSPADAPWFTVDEDGWFDFNEYEYIYNNPSLAEGEEPDGVIVVPSEIEGIDVNTVFSWAFYRCDSVKQVVLPEGTEVLFDEVFYNCEGLEEVWLPSTLTEIDHDLFTGCDDLKLVHFMGTQAQWDAIDVDERNDELFQHLVIDGGEVPVPDGPGHGV